MSDSLWATHGQAPLSTGFSRQEYWSGLPFPSPGDLPDPGIKPTSLMSPALSGRFFTIGTTWEGSPCSAYPQRNSKITPMYESPEYGPSDGDREWSDEPQGAWAWPLSPVPPQAMLLCLPATCGLSTSSRTKSGLIQHLWKVPALLHIFLQIIFSPGTQF